MVMWKYCLHEYTNYLSIYRGIKYTSFPIINDGNDLLFVKIGLQASDWILKCKNQNNSVYDWILETYICLIITK